jgi:5'-AMP-activated protein kinase, catalytic alpha subunit
MYVTGLIFALCVRKVLLKRGYDGAKADIWSCGVILFVLLAGYLPFNDNNLVCLYRKIMDSSYKCPPWFSVETRKLLARLLDPNPRTRITIAKLKARPWFQNGPCPLTDKPLVANDTTAAALLSKESHRRDDDDEEYARKRKRSKVTVSSPNIAVRPTSMNAFDIISRSRGLDLSKMFDAEHRSEVRFSTRETAEVIVSKLEEIAEEGRFSVTPKEKGRVVMEGSQDGRRGALSVEAEIFEVAPSVHVVELRKTDGDSIEFREFYRQDLKPSLGDIVWSWQSGDSPSPPSLAKAAPRRPTNW